MITDRRSFLFGLGAVMAAPAIVRYSNLMSMPRAPFVQLPSGLWVKAINRVTGAERIFKARAESRLGGGVNVEFDFDTQFSFDHVIVGRGENDLFSTDPQGVLWGNIGDSARIKVTLD